MKIFQVWILTSASCAVLRVYSTSAEKYDWHCDDVRTVIWTEKKLIWINSTFIKAKPKIS